MSDLDLTEAVEAIRDTWPGHHFTRNGALFAAPPVRDGGATDLLIRFAVESAAPIIAAQVREQIIEALRAERDEITGSRGPQDETIASESSFLSGLDRAIEVIEDGAR